MPREAFKDTEPGGEMTATAKFPLVVGERPIKTSYTPSRVIDKRADFHQQVGRLRKAFASVMFVDIVGFTAFVSSVKPIDAMTTLQAFCALMERCVLAHNGKVEKYLGDGLMVTFGAQVPTRTSALDAVRCATRMFTATNEWNAERGSVGLPAIKISIGAHSGEVVLGVIGVSRTELAVIGNCVNIASRLQQMASDRQVSIVLSEALFTKARSESLNGESAIQEFYLAGAWPISRALDSMISVAILRCVAPQFRAN